MLQCIKILSKSNNIRSSIKLYSNIVNSNPIYLNQNIILNSDPFYINNINNSLIKNNNINQISNVKDIYKNSFNNSNNSSFNSNKGYRYYSTHSNSADVKKVSILDLKKKYREGTPITMVTAYDYCSSKQVDNSGVDMILVGDSLGMVMLGEKGTTSVTMDNIIHHSKAVMKGSKLSFVVGDMPFGSFESSTRDAVLNAIRLVKEGGVEAVKLEGGKKHADKIRAIVEAGIPVVGHIGLTPQSVSSFGGFKLQGKTSDEANLILEDALALQEAGCFAIVMEMVPDAVASSVTKLLKIPTIGIGAGNGTSGQVLVYHDMLGMYSDFVPKFVKQYANISESIQSALLKFKSETESRQFPSANHSFSMKESELNTYIDSLSKKSEIDFQYLNENNNEILKLAKKSKPTNVNNENIINSTKLGASPSEKLIPEKVKKPKVVVIGAGAMGSFFSAKMASKGLADVWMVSAWKEHVDIINNKGLTLSGLDGKSENIRSIRATLDAMDVVKDGYPDLALVLVKSHSTKQAANTAATMVGGNPNAVVLTLQNGVGNREEIETSIIGKGFKNKVCQGVTSNGAVVDQPGHVRHTGYGQTFLASPNLKLNKDGSVLQPKTTEEHNALEALSDILNQAGISSELSYDVESLVWGKVVVNAAINPLSAVLGVPNGYLVKNEYSKNMMKKIINEGMDVAKAKGIRLPYGEDQEEGFKYAADIAERTKTNYSSMLQDVIRGQQTEIRHINGAIVKEGERLDVPVSYNKMVMEMVLSCFNNKKMVMNVNNY